MVQTLRQEKGLTQVQLAKKARVTQGYVAQLEAGLIKDPGIRAAIRIAKVLGVTVEGLLKLLSR
jgi:transcriptional regulator with XRE-family HTH domain